MKKPFFVNVVLLLILAILSGCSALGPRPESAVVVDCQGRDRDLCGPERPGEKELAAQVRMEYARRLGLSPTSTWDEIHQHELDLKRREAALQKGLPPDTPHEKIVCSGMMYEFLDFVEGNMDTTCRKALEKQIIASGLPPFMSFEDFLLAKRVQDMYFFGQKYHIPRNTPEDIVWLRMLKQQRRP